MQIEFPEGPPGFHPPTAALSRLLAHKNVLSPINQEPYSEALLLGVGGGLDTGYILYPFKHLPNPILVLGFRNQWNQTRNFIEHLAERLRLKIRFQVSNQEKQAEQQLQETIKSGKTAIVWVDKASLPYRHLADHKIGYITHQVTVYGRDGRLWRLYLDDLSTHPIEIREKTFTAARANLPEHNYLMMIFDQAEGLTPQDLRTACLEGIRDCTTQLTQPMQTLGISNLKTWANNLTDRHDPLGWPRVFKNQKNLFTALCTLYESIKLNGTDGFALRKMYADFLHEAAGILSNASLNAAAGQYLQLSNHWSNLADNALPSNIPVFDRTKSLLNKKYQAYRINDMQAYQNASEQLKPLIDEVEVAFPLDSHQTGQLYEKLSSRIKLIAELEMSAARRLREITR